jgi:hypothetical protein
MHQLLDCDDRVVDLSARNKVIQYPWRSTLHLIDVDAGVEQQTLPAEQSGID